MNLCDSTFPLGDLNNVIFIKEVTNPKPFHGGAILQATFSQVNSPGLIQPGQ